MTVDLPAGKYVVAVSGGIDSVVLLDMLHKLPGIKLVVAHYDHGIRSDSHLDRQHVAELAKTYGLPFVYHEGKHGPDTSEAAARTARYQFLHRVRLASGARAIVTAHHRDDLLETAILNLLRGTGRKGLSSLQSTDIVVRPLLHLTKHQLHTYAHVHKLQWREDSTNSDEAYLRNYVRRRIVPKFTMAQRRQLHELILRTAELNEQLDAYIVNYLHCQPHIHQLHRRSFISLPHGVAREVMASWLRNAGIRQFDRQTLERLVVAAKTARPGASIDIIQGHRLLTLKNTLALKLAER